MQVRLTGTRAEITTAVQRAFVVREVSNFYPNRRGYSNPPQGRVYIHIATPAERSA